MTEGDPFERRPNRTFAALTLPLFFSLIAEPMTALVDTAFIARLGSLPLAALGAAATLISSLYWVFNFIGIGAQTEVAHARGLRDAASASETAGVALALGLAAGTALTVMAAPIADILVALMGTTGEASEQAALYFRIRLLGAPAVVVTLASFGALRGDHDMRAPLWIALATNLTNLVLDPILIFGLGPAPALGLAGAAWASTAAQWLGGGIAVASVVRRLGVPPRPDWARARAFLVVGRDLVMRTATLLFFLALATRAANRLGTEAGAAHQSVRQVFVFTAFVLDAYGIAAQSLIGTYLASGQTALARRVALVSCGWGLATGAILWLTMLGLSGAAAALLVPPEARATFASAWVFAAAAQPASALAFVTDGIHWGASDYGYLRNAMLASTVLVGAVLLAGDTGQNLTLANIWLMILCWNSIRALFGVLRVWPGIGHAPLRPNAPIPAAS